MKKELKQKILPFREESLQFVNESLRYSIDGMLINSLEEILKNVDSTMEKVNFALSVNNVV